MDLHAVAVQKYVKSFVNGLYDAKVREVVICPGSRSTPLILAFSKDERFRTWILYDERSAAFFALGNGKSSLIPSALVSTSGTAAANFLPAIVEAKLSRVPLIAITADRPPESRDFGAPQTIDQVRIYGSYAKFFQDMPTAEHEVPSLSRYSQLVGARASYIAQTVPRGPVHVNFSFREPILSAEDLMADFESSPHLLITRVRTTPEKKDVIEALKEINDGSKGAIVVGPGKYDRDQLCDKLSQLSGLLGWPILGDPLANLRNEKAPFGLVRCYEYLLRNKSFRESNLPEWMIQVGSVPTSKELNAFTENARKIILDDAVGEWRDPGFSVCNMIYGDFEISLSIINEALRNFRAQTEWLDSWREADDKASKAVDQLMERIDQPFEGKLFHHLSKILKPSSPLTVVVGNSMPVRDLDAFFLDGDKNIELVANKGANGIDGVVSTAMGVSALEGNVLLIIGDISFYHDMNGLLASRLNDLKATIIVVNNKGGGIFSFLPQHSLLPEQLYEKLFGMPHDLDFSGVKTIYGGKYYRVDKWETFDQAFSGSLESEGLKIIEFIALDREANLDMHRSTFQDIASRVM